METSKFKLKLKMEILPFRIIPLIRVLKRNMIENQIHMTGSLKKPKKLALKKT